MALVTTCQCSTRAGQGGYKERLFSLSEHIELSVDSCVCSHLPCKVREQVYTICQTLVVTDPV